MTYPAPDILPYDEWFDPEYKYDPDKSEDIVINTSDGLEVVNVPKEADNIHQKMYEIATSKYNPFSVGGSESIHDFEWNRKRLMSK